MKIRLWPKRNWLRAAILLLAVVLVPYVFSRLASPWCCLSIHATPDVVSSKSAAPGTQLRIACYNIAHGRGVAVSNWDGGSREERINICFGKRVLGKVELALDSNMFPRGTFAGDKVDANIADVAFAGPVVPHPYIRETVGVERVEFKIPEHQSLKAVAEVAIAASVVAELLQNAIKGKLGHLRTSQAG